MTPVHYYECFLYFIYTYYQGKEKHLEIELSPRKKYPVKDHVLTVSKEQFIN